MSDMEPVESNSGSPSPQFFLGPRFNLKLGSPVMSKRRRMNADTPSSQGSLSPCGSPISSISLMAELQAAGFTDLNRTFEDLSDSNMSGSPTDSPTPFRNGSEKGRLQGKYRKDALWRAIRSDYQFLMDEEIIDTCKSTESDLSWESDDLATNSKVSFTEFMQQYKELMEWLNQIHAMTRRQSSSLSEKYLNQTYHEEMLQRSPRRKLFNDYAKQLMRRYPSMKEEITRRLQHLNTQWGAIEIAVSPRDGSHDPNKMLKDLESDLNGLRQWLHDMEGQLLPLSVQPSWKPDELKTKLVEHQVRQTDIESHSKIVSAVLKLCEHLQKDRPACINRSEIESLKLLATNLERRWHAIWLQSLEWQCRLEEALAGGKGLNRREDWSSFTFSRSRSSDYDLHDISEGEHSDDIGDLEFGFESDHSNSDVIPFSENEYEKIVVDADAQTDENGRSSGKTSPFSVSGKSIGSEECDMDTGTDSALGRSVSDPSVHSEQHGASVSHSAILITADPVNKGVNKAVSFAEQVRDMRVIPEPTTSPTGRSSPCHCGRGVTKSESHDIGYSSESHSNDDDTAADLTPKKPQSIGLGDVVLRRKGAESSSDGNENLSPTSANHNKSWRNSMTSAYDTSSNCSEPNSPYDLETSLDTTADSVATAIDLGEEHPLAADDDDDDNVQALISTCASGNQNYYCMTQVETDSESLVGSLKSTSSIQQYIESLAASTQCSDGATTDVGTRSDQQSPTPENFRQGILSDAASGEDGLCRWKQPITGFTKASLSARSESLIVQVDSDASARDAALSASDRSLPCDTSQTSPSKRIVSKLMHQAELLAREGKQLNASYGRKKSRFHRRPFVATNTDGSALPTEESHASSCDASSECTSSGTDSDGDYSTASGDDSDDNAYRGHRRLKNRTTLCDLSLVGKSQFSSSADTAVGMSHRSPLKRARDRPWSVTELYEITNRLDLSPFSTSEGALHTLSQGKKQGQSGSYYKLRRTTSESCSLNPGKQDTPKRHRRRKLKRSASDDLKETPTNSSGFSPDKLFHSTPYSKTPSSQRQKSRTSAEKSSSSDSTPQWCSSRALFSDTLPECETARHAASDSERDVTGKLLIAAYDSDASDAMVKSMNSTLESFSENAWDNYQAPPYAMYSDDPEEEKLQWEHHLEFEDDFNVEAELHAHKLLERSRAKRLSGKLFKSGSRADESDSDVEDLHHVIEESRQQLAVAEATLKKHRKDVMDAGIYLDPSKYAELVATCQTNIRCLEVIGDTLGSEDLHNVTQDDMNKVSDIIKRWVSLEGLAYERQQQARDLGTIYRDMVGLKKSMKDATDDLDINCFDNVSDLERTIKVLQENKLVLCQQRLRLAGLEDAVRDFGLKYPHVHLGTFQDELTSLQNNLDVLVDRSNSRVSELQSVMISWYDFNETRQELAYLLGQERAQLQVLALAQDLVALSPRDLSDTIHDLKAMEADFEFHSSKLESVRSLSGAIMNVSDENAQVTLMSRVATVNAELNTVRRSCRQLLAVLEEKSAKQESGAETTATQTELDLIGAYARLHADRTNMDTQTDKEEVPRRSMSPVLRAALPLSVLLVAAIGLAYLVNPSELGKMGIVFSPQLKYVRGPPPV